MRSKRCFSLRGFMDMVLLVNVPCLCVVGIVGLRERLL